MRWMAFVVLVFGGIQSLSSQTFFSLQAEVAEPTESFRNTVGTGFGVRGTYFHFIGGSFALTGSAGYVKWGPRVDFPPNNEFKIVSIPITMGAHLLLSRGVVSPYLGLSLGMSYLRIRGIASNSTLYNDSSELKFTFSPQVGVGIHIAGPVGLLLTGSYNLIYTPDPPSKFFGLNAGLALGL